MLPQFFLQCTELSLSELVTADKYLSTTLRVLRPFV